MRALIQRVTEARVEVGGAVIGEIGAGAMILVCAMQDDDEARAEALAAKIAKLRIFRDEDDRMNRSLLDCGGAALVVSQFTLYGETRKGRRPSWSAAARPQDAEPVVDAVVAALRGRGATVGTGEFGAQMAVESVNDGPFTVLVEV